MSVPRYGRWLRVEMESGAPRIVHLDHVEDIFKRVRGAGFRMSSGDVLLTNEPFEDTCLRVMVDETDILPQPPPPISRDQMAMFPERAS